MKRKERRREMTGRRGRGQREGMEEGVGEERWRRLEVNRMKTGGETTGGKVEARK